eukprot:148976-Prymnesium_polylepis.1
MVRAGRGGRIHRREAGVLAERAERLGDGVDGGQHDGQDSVELQLLEGSLFTRPACCFVVF